jgi:ABC-type multidrug transport system fused ATPase/permease subunit
MAGILLIKEFLAGVLTQTDGLAATFAQTVGPQAALWLVGFLLLLTFLGSSLFRYDNQVVQQRVVRSLELSIMQSLYRHLLSLSVAFYDRQEHGDLLEAVRQDISRVRMAVISLGRIFLEAVQVVGLLVTVVLLSPVLALWALPIFLVAAYPVWLVARRVRKRSYGLRRRGYVLFDLLLQMIRGIRVIKAYKGEDAEARNTISKARDYFNELVRMVRLQSLGQVAVESLAGLSIVIVIIIGGLQVMNGTLEWPALLAFLMAVRALHGPLNNVNREHLTVQRFSASFFRLIELLETKPELEDRPDALPFTEPLGSIRFDSVTFRYDSGDPVLRDLSFEIETGETVGVVGPSGAGKTSLLNLVARFYDPTSGRVLYNGRDLRDYRLADVYDRVAIVTQDPFLFTTSARENIRYGRPTASDADVEAAARAAGIHKELLSLPDGYDTIVGVGGRSLSGGQVQRLNVARAILKDAPLLLLDEATSSLDSIAEAKVQDAITQLMQGRTSFIIAHRLSTLRHATRIIVLEDGRCVGIGPHETLLAESRLYEDLWKTQQLSDQQRGKEG